VEHPRQGVETGTEPKAEVGRRCACRNPCNLFEGAEPLIGGAIELRESRGDEGAVTRCQFDDVGDRTEGGEREERLGTRSRGASGQTVVRVPTEAIAERRRYEPRQSGGAYILSVESAAILTGIDERIGG
jgi:hypothetical protein